MGLTGSGRLKSFANSRVIRLRSILTQLLLGFDSLHFQLDANNAIQHLLDEVTRCVGHLPLPFGIARYKLFALIS